MLCCVTVCLFGLCGWGHVFSTISQVNTRNLKDAWTSQKVLCLADSNFFSFSGCCCCRYVRRRHLLLLLFILQTLFFVVVLVYPSQTQFSKWFFRCFGTSTFVHFPFFINSYNGSLKNLDVVKGPISIYPIRHYFTSIFSVILSWKWRKSWRPPEYVSHRFPSKS